MMNKLAVKPQKTRLDLIKWILILLLLVAGLWVNYHYQQIDWPVRLAGWIVLACIVLAIAGQTAVGKQVWLFAQQSRAELHKVVWPTRQETLQTTLIIVGMVILMSLILWGIDSILLWLVELLTGQRG